MIPLYEHQKKALQEMHNGCILCGGVGSGKSRTALAYYYEKVCGGKLSSKQGFDDRPMARPKNLYVITTARKRDSLDWQKEGVYFGLTTHDELNPKVKFVVDSWNNIKKYEEIKDEFFIFDEQRVVGYGSWTKSFLRICKKNSWILLSATPGDTWSDYIPVFIANGFYRNKTEFAARHIVYSRFAKYPMVERYIDVERLIECKRKVLVEMPFIRNTTSHIISSKVGYNKRLFMQVFRARWNPYYERPITQAGEWCYILRRVCNEDPERLQRLLDIFDEHPRLIVFYNFDYELEALKDGLSSEILPLETEVAQYNGHKHDPVPEGERWIYLVQYTAASEAWNCITTDTIVFYSLNYSYKVMAQASGRTNRMNTPYTDLYYYLIYSDAPIDKSIITALKNKRNFNENRFYIRSNKED